MLTPCPCPQAPPAASELCQLLGHPQFGADSAPRPGCGALHVRGAHGTALLEQPAEAGHALPADALPGGSATPMPNGGHPHTSPPAPASWPGTPYVPRAHSWLHPAEGECPLQSRPVKALCYSTGLGDTSGLPGSALYPAGFGQTLPPLSLSLFTCAMGAAAPASQGVVG